MSTNLPSLSSTVWMKSLQISVLLEVRESNLPAQNCYAQAGFTVVGRRKNYYELPKEDALLMGRELV